MNNWRHVFLGAGPRVPAEFRDHVIDLIYQFNPSWSIDTDDRGYIIEIRNEDDDCLWHEDNDDSELVDIHFSNRFLQWMDEKTGHSKSKLIIGKATKLPIPGARPSHS